MEVILNLIPVDEPEICLKNHNNLCESHPELDSGSHAMKNRRTAPVRHGVPDQARHDLLWRVIMTINPVDEPDLCLKNHHNLCESHPEPDSGSHAMENYTAPDRYGVLDQVRHDLQWCDECKKKHIRLMTGN